MAYLTTQCDLVRLYIYRYTLQLCRLHARPVLYALLYILLYMLLYMLLYAFMYVLLHA